VENYCLSFRGIAVVLRMSRIKGIFWNGRQQRLHADSKGGEL
jgi:hypothetical protein